jgi:putative peptidoglycan lipid II flippase
VNANAVFVAAGILLSRFAGLIRQRVFAHYFGIQSEAADAFSAAFRIPNFLQNLFGEGALSASFIPVYAALVSRDERGTATEVAGAIAAILALVTSTLVLLGVLATPLLIDLIAPGFDGSKRELTIALVRILFPGAGLLVMSAWCLGILNSHHRFLVSYSAPVLWNAAMITTLVAYGGATSLATLAVYLAWGSVVGSAIQFGVQLPVVFRLVPGLRPRIAIRSDHVWTVLRNFVPAFISRGVVQISAYVDAMLASLLPTGAVAALANAQIIYTLPVSLFGISVSAAELPAMAGAAGIDNERLKKRLNAGLRQIAFFVVPSAVAFLALGDMVAGALLQTGRFTRADSIYVWGILAGSAFGLLASTLGRLYASTFYALRDTDTPLRYAVVRVSLGIVLGYLAAVRLPTLLGLDPKWGTAGLTMASSVAGWIEFVLLRGTINSRLGGTGIPGPVLLRLWTASFIAAAAGWGAKSVIGVGNPLIAAVATLGAYGVVYLGLTIVMGLPEARGALSHVIRRRRG